MSIGLYKICLVPGDLLYDEEGYAVAVAEQEGAGGEAANVRVDVAMEVKIRGYANYQRVICELAVAREARGYTLYVLEGCEVFVVDTEGPLEAGDYIVRSSRFPNFYERSVVRGFGSGVVGEMCEARTFMPRSLPVERPVQVSQERAVLSLVVVKKTLRKYSLKYTLDANSQRYIGEIVEGVVEMEEVEVEKRAIYNNKGDIIDYIEAQKQIETKKIVTEFVRDGDGNLVMEEVGREWEYDVQKIDANGLFVDGGDGGDGMAGGLFRVCKAKVNMFNHDYKL
jgi:hypothetical protein